jgi:hypothetical protein
MMHASGQSDRRLSFKQEKNTFYLKIDKKIRRKDVFTVRQGGEQSSTSIIHEKHVNWLCVDYTGHHNPV